MLTARLQIDRKSWQWPLKGIVEEEKAEALMAPIRVARERLRQAASETLNFALGTDEAVAAAAALTGARAQLRSAIIAADGPKELAELVLKGPQEDVGTAFPQTKAMPRRRAMKQAAVEKCIQAYIELIHAFPDGAPEPRDFLAQKMMNDFEPIPD